jgi:hypothetical protein
MAFYLSPLVDVQEIDLSTTIPAVATSIGVIVLRETKRGQEMSKIFVTSEEELIRGFGEPRNDSPACIKDTMAAAGYLKYGNKLYCTRVMPYDAQFAGIQLDSSDATTGFEPLMYLSGAGGDLDQIWVDNSAVQPQAYNLEPLGNPNDIGYTDMSKFHEAVQPSGADFAWFFADSRGAWGNNIRIGFINQADQEIIDNYEAYSDEASGWYPWNLDNEGNPQLRAPWDAATLASSATSADWKDPSEAIYDSIQAVHQTLQSDKEVLMVVQHRENAKDDWDTVETHVVSTEVEKLNLNGYPMYIETYINEISRYIKVTMNAAREDQPWTYSEPVWAYLEGGYDGYNPASVATGQTAPPEAGLIDPGSGVSLGLMREALDLYANPEEIDVTMIIDGDKPLNWKRYAVQFCETRKDCIAILDCAYDDVVDNRGNETTDLVDWRRDPTNSGNGLNENTSYAAVYGNWLEVYDKWNNKYRWIPAAGHVGGIYAHTDNVNDPWWAPAGLNRAILTGVRRLAWNPALGHRDLLYKNGINPIVSFAGQGKVIWGQKTMLDKPSSFDRVNVRRLFIVLEKAISTASKYFLFEPNDEITRLQLKSMIEPFLRDVQARRGIYEFQVICDETNNTPERIDRNELWCTILIKATRVAEFIVLQFVSLKTGASFEEAAQQVNPKV